MIPLQATKSQFTEKTLPPKFGYHIAVVATHTDGLRETGFGTIKTCMTFCETLKERYARVTFHSIEDLPSLDNIARVKPDLVVLCGKYIINPKSNCKIWFAEYFAEKGINHTGSDRRALEFDSNKSKAKTILRNEGIATAKYFLTNPGQYQSEDRLPLNLPVFVKPLDAANGFGIDENSIARNFEAYKKKVTEIFLLHNTKVLVEEVLPGREFTVAVFDDQTNGQRWTLPMEIVPQKNSKGDRVLGYAEKQNNMEEVKSVGAPLSTKLNQLASEAFTALGAKDFGRVDIKLDATEKPNFLEINLVPGMTPDSSYFPRACSFQSAYTVKDNPESGMSYADVVNKIAELGLQRAEIATTL